MSHFDMPVRDYMSAPVHAIAANTKLEVVDRLLSTYRISALPVTDTGGAIRGVVSQSDLLAVGRWHPTNGGRQKTLSLPEGTAGEVMTREVITVGPEDRVASAAKLMVKNRIHRVFVVDNDKPTGVLSTKDIMHAVIDVGVRTPLAELMTTSVVSVSSADPVSLAVDRMAAAHVQGLVVIEDGWPVGIFTQVDALAARHARPDSPAEQWMSSSFLCLPMGMPVNRAAAQAISTDVRRVLAMDATQLRGILTGLDLARAAT